MQRNTKNDIYTNTQEPEKSSKRKCNSLGRNCYRIDGRLLGKASLPLFSVFQSVQLVIHWSILDNFSRQAQNLHIHSDQYFSSILSDCIVCRGGKTWTHVGGPFVLKRGKQSSMCPAGLGSGQWLGRKYCSCRCDVQAYFYCASVKQ